jgi:hypothetical protein
MHLHKDNTRLSQKKNNPHIGHGLTKKTPIVSRAWVVGFSISSGMTYAPEPYT